MRTDSDKARACLPQLNQTRCDDYAEWVAVGMALKAAGCTAEDWDQWSRGSTKYKAGACQKKWDTFKGAGSSGDVGTGSLIRMMRDDGGNLDQLFENKSYGWDEPIPVNHAWPAPGSDQEPDMGIPTSTDLTDSPAQDLITYINSVFRPEEFVAYVTESWKNDEGKWLPKNKGVFGRTAAQIVDALKRSPDDIAAAIGDWPQEAGAWIRVNPMDGKGVKNDNVAEYRHVLVESDTLPIDRQLEILKSSRLPYSALVHSGGKSIHALVRIDAGKDFNLYRDRVDAVFAYLADRGFIVDKQCRNASRLSRMPSVTRGDQTQALLASAGGSTSYAAWEASLRGIAAPEPINVSTWLDMELPPAEHIIGHTLDAGDKLVVIAPSKQRKSFFFVQMMLAIARGKDFLTWNIPKARRVLLVQFEVRDYHYHRRIKRMCASMNISPKDLQDNLYVLNCRGKDIEMVYEAIETCAEWFKPEMIGFDPFYKMHSGDENSAQDIKPVLQRLDALAERTGAAVAYVHHDAKGVSGDRNIRDRGAGSNIVGRDYDACFTITPHVDDEDNMSVIETMLRNYAPQAPRTVKWGGAYFEELDSIPANSAADRGQRGRPPKPEAAWYADDAMAAIGDTVHQRGVLQDLLAARLSISASKSKALISVLEDAGKLHKHTSKSFPKTTHFGTEKALLDFGKDVQTEAKI